MEATSYAHNLGILRPYVKGIIAVLFIVFITAMVLIFTDTGE
jgi:hypothetical protein